jgi:hypothetical protein
MINNEDMIPAYVLAREVFGCTMYFPARRTVTAVTRLSEANHYFTKQLAIAAIASLRESKLHGRYTYRMVPVLYNAMSGSLEEI